MNPEAHEPSGSQTLESVNNSKYVLSRLTGLTIFIYVAGAAASGVLTYGVISRVMLEQNQDKLEAILESRATAVEECYRVMQAHVGYVAANELVIGALEDFSAGYASIAQDLGLDASEGSDEYAELLAYYDGDFLTRLPQTGAKELRTEDYLPSSSSGRVAQWVYIARNPNDPARKSELTTSPFRSDYEDAHRSYHPRLTHLMEAFEFHDILLFDVEGNLVYSALKEVDFGTNFHDGPHAESGLGQACRGVLASSSRAVTLIDFSNYEPSYGEPASFLASAVHDEGRKIGVLAFQLDSEKLNTAVADLAGLGRTTETYIIGDDLLMRTDSRFEPSSTILRQTVNSTAASDVVRGRSGSTICEDYRGIEVLSHYRPLRIPGLQWGILAEVDKAEVMAPSRTLALYTSGILVVTILIIAFVSMITLRLCVVRPMRQLLVAATQFRKGNYNARIHILARDEFGTLAESHNQMAHAIQGHIVGLEETLSEIKELRGLLPICAACKSIRDDDGYFKTVETYLIGRSNLEFSHTICQECLPRLYPELDLERDLPSTEITGETSARAHPSG